MFWKKGNKKTDKAEGTKPNRGKWKTAQSAVRKLDATFSLYIRLRDSRQYDGKYFRCISCGRVLPYEKGDCGHYISRRNMVLRFSEDNCHMQCSHCNRFQDGNILDYRAGLVRKIGEQRVQMLEAQRHDTKKWSVWELDILNDHYKEEIAKLKSQL